MTIVEKPKFVSRHLKLNLLSMHQDLDHKKNLVMYQDGAGVLESLIDA